MLNTRYIITSREQKIKCWVMISHKILFSWNLYRQRRRKRVFFVPKMINSETSCALFQGNWTSVLCFESKKKEVNHIIFRWYFDYLNHGQSSYWTAKSSFLFLASDHTEADPNYTLGVDFWTMIFYNLKNSG